MLDASVVGGESAWRRVAETSVAEAVDVAIVATNAPITTSTPTTLSISVSRVS
ncbi:MAG: hypothetical protein R2873_16770 [Caldilineaceae bacterium]